MASHLKILQDPMNKEETPAKISPLDQEAHARGVKGGCMDCKGVKAQGFLRNSVCWCGVAAQLEYFKEPTFRDSAMENVGSGQ